MSVEQLEAELSAARATIRSLERQLTLRIDAITMECMAPSEFDEPTRRQRPALVRRSDLRPTEVIPCAEVRQ